MADAGSAFELQCQALFYSAQALERSAADVDRPGRAHGDGKLNLDWLQEQAAGGNASSTRCG